MQFKSQSFAKALLGLSIAIALTSVYFGREWTTAAVSLKNNVVSQQKKLADAKAANAELSELLVPDANAMPLDKVVSNLMLTVFNRRVEHGVSLSYATPAKQGGGGSMSQLNTLTEDVPGTSVKSVRVNLSGTYTSYIGLLGYLKDLQQGSAAVVRLKVQDQTFEVALRVYGTV